MEGVTIELSADKFDKALHGGLDDLPVLREGGDLAMYVKPKGTVQGKAAIVFTFTVQLPDGSLARAQTVVTENLFNMMAGAMRGWQTGGYLK